MRKPIVSVLIVSYNTRELTLVCLQSVYAQTPDVPLEVIVVDNASVDGSAEAIAERFPQVRLIRSAENTGFAAANNLAARHAQGEYLLLLNPDTVILDKAIEKALAFAQKRPSAGIIGGRTLFADGRLNPTSCHGTPTMWSMFCMVLGLSALGRGSNLLDPESLGSWKRDSVREVPAVTGCFLLIRRSLWEELGGFDESFFMYGEETDLCLRAWAKGHKCLICPDAKLIHHGGRSEKTRADKMVKLFAAKARLFQKHWRPGMVGFGARMLDLWAFGRMVAFGVLRLFQPRHDEALRTWHAIWRRRAAWQSPQKIQSAHAPAAIGGKP